MPGRGDRDGGRERGTEGRRGADGTAERAWPAAAHDADRAPDREGLAVERDGLTFDVALSGPGGGRPLLLLHGFPQTRESWRAVVPRLTERGFRCAVVTQRGYAPGARPAGIDAYAIEHLVGDALAIADAIQPDGPIDVVGHDWGASVGWFLAARHGERVRSLTAASVPHLAAYGRAAREDPEQQRMVGYMREFHDPGVADRLLADGARELRAFVGDRLPAAALDRYVEQFGGRDGLDAGISWYRANGRTLHDLEPVAVPTTFVWGTHDPYIGAAAARACGDHVTADYRYVELPDIGHWIPEEAPEALAREIGRRASG